MRNPFKKFKKEKEILEAVDFYKAVDGLGYDLGGVKVDYVHRVYQVYGSRECPIVKYINVEAGEIGLKNLAKGCEILKFKKVDNIDDYK